MLGPAPGQRFIYVLEGKLDLLAAGKKYVMAPSGYAYLPTGTKHTVRAKSDARAAIIEKLYEPLPDEDKERPRIVVGKEADVAATPLMGDEALRVRTLMPDGPAYDFAVNTMTYDPGAALSMVEILSLIHI